MNPEAFYTAPRQPPLALRILALMEISKALLVVAAVCGLLSLRHTDLHAATDAFLLRHRIDPETHYKRLFIESVAKATNHHGGEIASVALAYALLRLVEGYGLWQGRPWAEWIAVVSAGLYLPIELRHFAHRPTLFNTSFILLNLILVFYLGRLLIQQRTRRSVHPKKAI